MRVALDPGGRARGAVRPSIATVFIARALQRCPNEPRLNLALAVVTEQQWLRNLQTSPAETADVTRRVQCLHRRTRTCVTSSISSEARCSTGWAGSTRPKPRSAPHLRPGLEPNPRGSR